MERFAYWNKILHVSLADRRTWIEEPGDEFFRRYAGGRGRRPASPARGSPGTRAS